MKYKSATDCIFAFQVLGFVTALSALVTKTVTCQIQNQLVLQWSWKPRKSQDYFYYLPYFSDHKVHQIWRSINN